MPEKERTSFEIQNAKNRLRKLFFKRFKRLKQKAADENRIIDIHQKMRENLKALFLQLDVNFQKKSFMAYSPLNSEPPVLEIIRPLNLNVYIPEIDGDTLKAVSLNTKERKEVKEIDIIVVPGLFVTKEGFRLGRGKGYYDKTLDSAPESKTVFLCYSWQILRKLPAEKHDIRIKSVCSEKEWFLT